MTEDEARKKWCPFARFIAPLDKNGVIAAMTDGCNRIFASADNHELNPSAARCIASECMAWRNVFEKQEKKGAPVGVKENVLVGGYCGLAGKP